MPTPVRFTLALLVALVAGTARADDVETDTGDASTREPAPTEPAPKQAAPKKKQGQETLSELLSRLLDEDDETPEDEEEGDDPLERAIGRMRQAGDRLAEKDTGESTQDLQRKALSDLDELIELARKQQSQSAQSGSQADQQPMQGDDDRRKQPGQGEPAVAEGGRRKDDPASESTDQSEQGEDRETEVARREELANDVWGHLPQRVRKQLLNAYREDYLPRYEDLVKAYFEALAERATEDE